MPRRVFYWVLDFLASSAQVGQAKASGVKTWQRGMPTVPMGDHVFSAVSDCSWDTTPFSAHPIPDPHPPQ